MKTERVQSNREIENINYLSDRQRDYLIKLERLQNNESKAKDNEFNFKDVMDS